MQALDEDTQTVNGLPTPSSNMFGATTYQELFLFWTM
jgi:hypothetical protein